MPEEPVRLHTRDKRQVDATAEVTRPDELKRGAKAIALLVGGIVLGAASIVVPILHFVSVWAFPLVGAVAAYLVYNQAVLVRRVHGECPLCGAALDAEGGAWEDPMWIRCQACTGPLRVELVGPPAADRAG